jgi:hypothetical protein
MNAELTSRLGYEKHDPAGRNWGIQSEKASLGRYTLMQ